VEKEERGPAGEEAAAAEKRRRQADSFSNTLSIGGLMCLCVCILLVKKRVLRRREGTDGARRYLGDKQRKK
jgi:hypothetical protein